MKLFSCSTQLSTKFILLINVKMPTYVGILTLISMINTTSERLKAINFCICRYFSFYEQLKFPVEISCSVELRMKIVFNLRAWLLLILYSTYQIYLLQVNHKLRDFPRPDFGPNIGPFPIKKNEQLFPKWCLSFPISLFYILAKIS